MLLCIFCFVVFVIFVKIKTSPLGTVLEFTYYENKSEIIAKTNTDVILYSFEDEFENKNDLTTFNRIFKNRKYYFVNSKLVKLENISNSNGE